MHTSKQGRRGWFRKHFGLSRTLGRQRGFTMTELMVTCAILAVMVTIASIAYASGTRKTEVVAATEQVKQVFRYAYSLTDSGNTTGGVKWQYRLTFNNNEEPETVPGPPNACLIEVSTNGGFSWAAVTPKKAAAFKVISTNWVQLGTPDIQMGYTKKTVTYVCRGSMVTIAPYTGDPLITIGSSSDGSSRDVSVNTWGTINE